MTWVYWQKYSKVSNSNTEKTHIIQHESIRYSNALHYYMAYYLQIFWIACDVAKYFRQELIETFDKFAKLNREATIFFSHMDLWKKSPFYLSICLEQQSELKKRKLVIQKCFVSRASKVWKARRTLDLNFELLKIRMSQTQNLNKVIFDFIPLCSG